MDTGNGKAPLNGGASSNRKPPNTSGLVTVEPPRREDLQPAYAQLLHGDDDASAHGWYGAMSMCFRHFSSPFHCPNTSLKERRNED